MLRSVISKRRPAAISAWAGTICRGATESNERISAVADNWLRASSRRLAFFNLAGVMELSLRAKTRPDYICFPLCAPPIEFVIRSGLQQAVRWMGSRRLTRLLV